jgi:hypothetical protein
LSPNFSDYTFWVHHLVNWDDRHLLAHAMASDFSVAWQCLSKRTIGFLLRIKLHALIRLGVSPPSLIDQSLFCLRGSLLLLPAGLRVARWFIFKPKSQFG